MKRIQSTDFDVITGPSMASACPVVETMPREAISPQQATASVAVPAEAARQPVAQKADAA
ncbi:MAG TPA: hypothetical protein VM639_22780 [Dongiaceae bacterium]|nr:hypothetical protein [Dongiaceae bacterium]